MVNIELRKIRSPIVDRVTMPGVAPRRKVLGILARTLDGDVFSGRKGSKIGSSARSSLSAKPFDQEL